MGACNRLRIPVIRSVVIQGKEGMLFRNGRGRAVIFVNPLASRNRSAYIGMHELAHYYSPIYSYSETKTEMRANRWLAKFLLPPRLIINAILDGCCTCQDIAEKYDLPQEFICKTIENYAQTSERGVIYKKWILKFVPYLSIVNTVTGEELPER